MAVQPTCLATIAQRAPEQECWGGGASPSRALPPGCREGGARVSSHVMVRGLDLRAPNVHDGRRFEVVAEGLPLFGGAHLAFVSTLVSALHCDGSARPHAADVDGVALPPRRRRKELTYPQTLGSTQQGQVGGSRWRGGWTVVSRDHAIPGLVGQSQSTARNSPQEASCRAGMAHPVELHVGVCGRACIRSLVA